MVTVALFGADEDSVLVRLRLRQGGLGTIGAYVQEVQSGAVDLGAFLDRYRPDVVIYDFVHPATESTRWLRQLERVCAKLEIPCVLTVHDMRDLRHVVKSWAACILIRPYDAEMVRLAIRGAMNGEAEDEEADVEDDEGGEAAA
jgi:DNA-binding NarL/FixJ family response regulator